MTTPAISPRQAFAREVSRPDPELDLARAALHLAREEYPQLPLELYLGRLDALAEEVRDRIGSESAPLLVLGEMGRVLFRRHRFRGDRTRHYDPRNLYLNDVLDRELGIPLTLGIVHLEVGWRLGLPLCGVGLPGRFLVRFEGEAAPLFVDPYDAGRCYFPDEAGALLERACGRAVRPHAALLRGLSKREILLRLLGSLKLLYLNVRDFPRALAAVERLLLIRPGEPEELRDQGTILARLGRREEAARDLEEYLDFAPRARDAARVRALLDSLQRGSRRGRGRRR